MSSISCRFCGVPYPGDENISLDDLRRREVPSLPVCIKAPPSNRWFVDSGINGHMFDLRKETGS